MTRAHIADPHIARKVAEGREHEIRPCVGVSYCIDRIYLGGDALCIHNPATGREASMPHEVSREARAPQEGGRGRRRPGGFGGGAGAAARGHEVVLFEAASEAGGQIRLTAQLKRRREIMGIVDWRLAQCAAHGVELRFNAYAEADDI